METVILEFASVTKYPLREYLERYVNFSKEHYSGLSRYYSGETEELSHVAVSELDWLLDESSKITSIFKNFESKLGNCGFWELLEMLDDIGVELAKITKLPKYARVVRSKNSYKRSVQASGSVGSGFTFEDMERRMSNIGGRSTWDELMRNNDIRELGWEIDELKDVDAYVDRQFEAASTVLDSPIGERVYGKDILRRIGFKDGDLITLVGKDNLDQKVSILIEMNRGDVPEEPLFGKNPFFAGVAARQFSTIEAINDIRRTFLQNDLFHDVSVVELVEEDSENEAITVILGIKTIYDGETTKKIIL